MPLASLIAAADFYMEKEGLMVLEEDQKVLLCTYLHSTAQHRPLPGLREGKAAALPPTINPEILGEALI